MILLKKAGLVVILAVIAWCVLHPFRELELGWLYWLRTDRPVSDKIWIVSIDEEIEKTNKPIPHSRYAQLIDALFEQYNSLQIGFDVFFGEDQKNDDILTKAATKAGCVYFGIPSVDGKGEEYPVTGCSYPCNLKGTTDKIIELSGMQSALSDSVLQNAAGIGHIANIETRVIKRIPLIVRYHGKLYPSLVLQIAGDYFCKSLHIPREQLEIVLIGDYISLRKKHTNNLLCQIPVDEKCQMLVNFAETNKDSFAFRVRSIGDILNLPASEELKEKIVLAGGVTNTTGDMYPSPFAIYPGVGILANALENIIDNRFLHQPLKGSGFFLFPILIALISCGMSGRRLKWQIWVAIAGVAVY
ncbi:MAG: CHASE2 domain-containing protein, partial [Candidatus Desantisbacteria bacterium]